MKKAIPDGIYYVQDRITFVKGNNFVNEYGMWQPCFTLPNGSFKPIEE